VIKIFKKWTFFFNTIIKLTFPKHIQQFINIYNFNQWFDVFFFAIEFFQEYHSFHATNFQQCEAFTIELQQNLDTSWLCTIWISTFITFFLKKRENEEERSLESKWERRLVTCTIWCHQQNNCKDHKKLALDTNRTLRKI
jgi:hypothetical protein